MRQRANGFVQHNPAMVEDFLELGRGLAALLGGQINFAAHIDGVQSRRETELVESGGLKGFEIEGIGHLAKCASDEPD